MIEWMIRRSCYTLICGIVLLWATIATAQTQPEPAVSEDTEGARVRIGTFDSRAVALAYRNTEAWRKEVGRMRSVLAEAERTRDRKKIREMNLLGPSRQHLSHQQVFSNGSIVDIVPHFRDALPEIAKRREVVLIVSKWEVPYQASGIETVDVTEDIVALFSPDQQTRKWLEGLKTNPPMPLDELVYDPSH